MFSDSVDNWLSVVEGRTVLEVDGGGVKDVWLAVVIEGTSAVVDISVVVEEETCVVTVDDTPFVDEGNTIVVWLSKNG